MDRRRRRRSGHCRAIALIRRIMVRRHDEDRARARQSSAQPGEEVPRRAGLERHHRRAVRKEKARETAHRSGGELQAIDCRRSEEHTSELQSLMRISYAVFCLKKKKKNKNRKHNITEIRRTHQKK